MRYLGLDLGGTNIKGVVVEVHEDGSAVALTEATVPTGGIDGPDAVTGRIVALGQELVASWGEVAGAGLCVPGLFDPFTGVIEFFANLPGPWKGFPMRQRLGAGLGEAAGVLEGGGGVAVGRGRMGAGPGGSGPGGLKPGTRARGGPVGRGPAAPGR